MAWYEYRPAVKPLYRQFLPGRRASFLDALLVYGGLLLAVVAVIGGLLAVVAFWGFAALWPFLAIGAAYIILSRR